MSTNMETKEMSFWTFIQKFKVEIPIIQRDYAQGRLGKENLRKNFLNDLKTALDNCDSNANEKLKLDFVYGSTEDNKLNPLDGQQRLTTLWLLHWYIALRSNKLDEVVANILARFSYETRISSRDFCQNLCKPNQFKDFNGEDIVDYILKQTWFYVAWKQDPTIQSMLRMLGGTKNNTNKSQEILDCIEKVFRGCTVHEFEKYWDLLTQKEVIVFYHLPLENFGLSDDLYIKMNARGKQLTDFENFKADLIGYIVKQSESKDAEWVAILDPVAGIPIKMDTSWTNLFWEKKSKNNEIDGIFFAFINRLFWNELFTAKDNGLPILKIGPGVYNEKKERNVENFNLSYKCFNDETSTYSDLTPYRYYQNTIPISFFKCMKNVLDQLTKMNELNVLSEFEQALLCAWDDKFLFIPKYENNGSVSTINQIHRVVFYAVCKYLNEGDYDLPSLKKWMRVVWNLISGMADDGNPLIRNSEAIRTYIRIIEKLNSHDVYTCLSEQEYSKDDNAGRRFNEEINKARQILEGPARSDGKTWEDSIIEAESSVFFHGSIRFLFQDEKGSVDWTLFDEKYKNAKNFFKEDGATDLKILENYLDSVSDFEDLKKIYYNDSEVSWMNKILLNQCVASSAHNFMTKISGNRTEWNQVQLNVLNDLKKILPGVYGNFELDDSGNYYCLKVRGRGNGQDWKKFYIGNSRNKILMDYYGGEEKSSSANGLQKIYSDQKISNCNFFWGEEIKFKYRNHFFVWQLDDKIYLRQDDNQRIFYFEWSDGKDFLGELDNLINQNNK